MKPSCNNSVHHAPPMSLKSCRAVDRRLCNAPTARKSLKCPAGLRACCLCTTPAGAFLRPCRAHYGLILLVRQHATAFRNAAHLHLQPLSLQHRFQSACACWVEKGFCLSHAAGPLHCASLQVALQHVAMPGPAISD